MIAFLPVSVLSLTVVALLSAAPFLSGPGAARGHVQPESTASSGSATPEPAPSPPRDSDGDGMPDRWERNHGLDPRRANAGGDPDRDWLTNILEFWFEGNPRDPDTDGDGLRDGPEVKRWYTAVNVKDQVVGRILGSGLCAQQPCPPLPLFGLTVSLRDPEGREVASTATHTNGRFAFRAAPGTYTVDPQAPPYLVAPGPPQVITVTSGQSRPARTRFEYSPTTGPGVIGQATRSPTCPVEQIGQECVAPLEDAGIHIEDSSGATVASEITGENGFYAFSLEPGVYRLVAEPFEDDGFPYPPEPVEFTVTAEDTGPHWIGVVYYTGIQ